jgi:hypothetical protein
MLFRHSGGVLQRDAIARGRPGTPTMTSADATRAYLSARVESLAPLEFVVVAPSGNPLQSVQIGRSSEGELNITIPGRPRIAPELPLEVRGALRDRGFTCEDASDPRNPWLRASDDIDAAIDLILSLLTDVFNIKVDHPLDVVHGSQKAEFEARQKLAAVRENVERILTELIEAAPETDADGDFQLPLGDVRVTVAPRALPQGPVIVRVFAVTNVNVAVTPELGLVLARLNFGLMFGRFALDTAHNAIWFDETLLGEQFSDEELRFAIRVVANTADEWDDRFKQMFGGSTYQEVVKLSEAGAEPPVKPGEGPGLYL